MSWETELVTMVRVLANDLSAPQKYDDAYLRQVIACASVLVQKDIELPIEYTIGVTAGTISPDPVSSGDMVFQALVPLKAACILMQGQYVNAVGRAIKVRDGDSQIDTSVGFRGFRDILELGPCHTYEKLRWQLQAGAGEVGGAVLGPYRPPGRSPLDTISYFYDAFVNYVGHRKRVLGG